MPEPEERAGTTIIPTMRYRDAAAAIEWLCGAFGFDRHLVVPGENGTIVHAELTLGSAMIMLGTVKNDEFGQLTRQPTEAGGVTQSPYMVVHEVEAHYRRAQAAGAEIVVPLRREDFGRLYSCRDPEGHLWNFGDYDPWRPAGGGGR